MRSELTYLTLLTSFFNPNCFWIIVYFINHQHCQNKQRGTNENSLIFNKWLFKWYFFDIQPADKLPVCWMKSFVEAGIYSHRSKPRILLFSQESTLSSDSKLCLSFGGCERQQHSTRNPCHISMSKRKTSLLLECQTRNSRRGISYFV